MKNEFWKPVVGWEGIYEVSNYGNVRRLPHIKYNHIRYLHSTKDNRFGYCRVMLCRNNKPVRYLVHRLVAEAFIPNPCNKPCIDHINGIRDDNRVENLRWCTHLENNNFEHTRKSMSLSHKRLYDTEKGRALAEERKIKFGKAIKVFDKQGALVGVFPSQNEASKATGYSIATISKVCKGEFKNKKYNFEYA